MTSTNEKDKEGHDKQQIDQAIPSVEADTSDLTYN